MSGGSDTDLKQQMTEWALVAHVEFDARRRGWRCAKMCPLTKICGQVANLASIGTGSRR
jgi:hypothetical protein